MTLRRFPGGISYDGADAPLASLPYADQTLYATFWDDFLAYDKTQLIGGNPYTLTATNVIDTIIGPTGVLLLSTGGADNDLGQLQSIEAAFQLSSTKKTFFETRIKIDKGAAGTIGEQVWFVGLAGLQTGASFMNSNGLVRTFDDGIGFISYDGSTNIECLQCRSDSPNSALAASTYADVTWMTLSIYYDGTTSLFYKDDALIATLAGNAPTAVVAPTLYIEAGEAKPSVLNVDYVLVAQER